jgi:hypothetical protein
MKETVSDALDWRHHFRNNPIAFSVGALSVGFLVGYGLAGTFKGDGDGYPSSEETDVYARTGSTPSRYEDEDDGSARQSAFHGHSYAGQPITDQAEEAVGQDRRSSYDASEEDESYGRAAASASPSGGSVSYLAPREARNEQAPEKPGLFERFKETNAYDRLQSEVSTLGERFMEELSTTAHTVVLPALFNKIKELFGVDLGGQKGQQASGGGQSEQQQQQQSQAGGAQTGARAASASASSASGSLASASRGSSDASYATSENRGYGSQAAARENERGEGSSVLDLDR